MLRYQNPSERSLKHALLVELLLKLRRGKVQLQVLPSSSSSLNYELPTHSCTRKLLPHTVVPLPI